MNRTCRTCPRDAAPGLFHCDRCVRDRFFTAEPPRRPAWVERMDRNAKVFSGGRAA